MSIIIERYYQLLSLLLISEMLECEKICVLELMKESMSCFFAFGNKDLLKGSRQGHFGLQSRILAIVPRQIYAGR